MIRVSQLVFLVPLLALVTCDRAPRSDRPGERRLADLVTPTAGEWVMFKRDLARTGRVDSSTKGHMTDANNVCRKWRTSVGGNGGGRHESQPLIATINGTKTVFVATTGSSSDQDSNGNVIALAGTDGTIQWTTHISKQTDPYGPLLVDIDNDANYQGKRELIVPAMNDNKVYALRTEAEGANAAGSIKYTFTLSGTTKGSEAGPAAADMDGDGKLDVLLGWDSGDFTAITGDSWGSALGTFQARTKVGYDADCTGQTERYKIDSSSPAVVSISSNNRIFVGAWDGRLYELGWSSGSLAQIAADDITTSTSNMTCETPAAVRTTPAVDDIVTGDSGALEVVFGWMLTPPTDYASAQLRRMTASGLPNDSAKVDISNVDDWKSSPAVGALNSASGLETASAQIYNAGTGTHFVAFSTGSTSFTVSNGGTAYVRTYNSSVDPKGSCAIADIDGNAGSPTAGLEIICPQISSATNEIVAMNANGSSLTEVWAVDIDHMGESDSEVLGGVAIGDIDSDSNLEIVFLATNGYLYALDNSCN